jgi:hypothetical protein
MTETATIPETFEVPTDALIDAVAFFFHLSQRLCILNGRASTAEMAEIDAAGCLLFHAAFKQPYGDGDADLERRCDRTADALTREWAETVYNEANR